MQFDLPDFLAAMFKIFIQCQDDGETRTPSEMMQLNNRPVIRFAVARELRRQARRQGAKRRERRDFQRKHMDEPMSGLKDAVDKHSR